MHFTAYKNSLDEDSVDEDKGERHDEQDVREVKDELWDEVLRAVPLHVPVSDPNLDVFKEKPVITSC